MGTHDLNTRKYNTGHIVAESDIINLISHRKKCVDIE